MVEKKFNDSTTVTFTMEDFSSGKVIVERWEIRFNEFETQSVIEFLESNFAGVATPLCKVEDHQYDFFVQSKFSDLFFRCSFWHASEIDEVWLEIVHYYPSYYRGGSRNGRSE
jgi:hypothetical protein